MAVTKENEFGSLEQSIEDILATRGLIATAAEFSVACGELEARRSLLENQLGQLITIRDETIHKLDIDADMPLFVLITPIGAIVDAKCFIQQAMWGRLAKTNTQIEQINSELAINPRPVNEDAL